MGLSTWKGKDITFIDARTAKNYLSELEIKKLELLSEQFLSFAELRYYDKKPMTMNEWEAKLDEFLIFNEKLILTGKGTISSQDMIKTVKDQLDKYKQRSIKVT